MRSKPDAGRGKPSESPVDDDAWARARKCGLSVKREWRCGNDTIARSTCMSACSDGTDAAADKAAATDCAECERRASVSVEADEDLLSEAVECIAALSDEVDEEGRIAAMLGRVARNARSAESAGEILAPFAANSSSSNASSLLKTSSSWSSALCCTMCSSERDADEAGREFKRDAERSSDEVGRDADVNADAAG